MAIKNLHLAHILVGFLAAAKVIDIVRAVLS